MFCSECGAEIHAGDKFCQNCGSPVKASEQTQRQENNYYNDNHQTDNSHQTEYGSYNGYQSGNGGYNNSYQTGNGGSGTEMPKAPVQNRSIALYLILSIITCGIFAIYWMVVVVDDLKTVTEEPQEMSGGLVFLLALVTCNIYGIYWMYKAGSRTENLRARLGRPKGDRPVIYLLLSLFGLNLVNFALIQNDLNNFAEGTY